jgi:hypothetical protein
MKFSVSLFAALLFRASQANFQCSAFRIFSAPKDVSTIPSQVKSKSRSNTRISPIVIGTLAASLLPHPKLANAIGVGSRVPLPVTPGGLELATINKRVAQTAVLFSWTLLIVVALEWNRFEYFRHLACGIRNLGKEDDEMVDVGLARESDWSTYSHLLDPLQKKKQIGFRARIMNLFRHLNRHKVAVFEQDEDGLLQANKLFRDKKYEQHHHRVHVTQSKELPITYLESLSSKCTSVDPVEVHHDKSYLDTLSDLNAKKSTWADYKMTVDRMKKEWLDEGKDLQNKVSELQNLMHDEQSMYQTSNQALKLALDAQNQQLRHNANDSSRGSALKDLEDFDKMTNDFEQTILTDMAAQKAAGVVEDDVRSVVYEL